MEKIKLSFVPVENENNSKDTLGDRMKYYEKIANITQWDGLKPVIVRLDGRGFHRYRKLLKRPFDIIFREIMYETMKHLVEEFNAVVGYTQSDEITLVFYAPNELSQLPFGGKQQKLTSVIVSACTAHFSNLASASYIVEGDDKYISLIGSQFDCRCFEVPDESEAVNNLYWRFLDCTRNSILAVAQYVFGNKRIFGKKIPELLEMLKAEGHDWDTTYATTEKYGTFFVRNNKITNSFNMKEWSHDDLIKFVFGE